MSLDATSLSPADRAALDAALNQLEQDGRSEAWAADPVAWVQDRLGEHVWSKQAEVMRAVHTHKLVAVQSSHGVGKSHLASRIAGYYLDVFDPGEFFVITTAPTWAQVRAILWRYIGQMHARANLPGYVTQNAEWKIGTELVAFGRKPADTDQQGMQGLHATRGVIAIIDEGSGVPDQIFNAVDSLATTPESRIVVLGNPDSISSRFHRVCTTEPGWHRIRIASSDTPAWTGEQVPPELLASLVSQEWVEDKRLRWGERSPLYRIKVEGEFCADDDTALIPMSWVIAAQRRWHEWNDSSIRDSEQPHGLRVFGVDVALGGEDLTAIATRQGEVVMSVETWAQLDTIAIANIAQARLDGTPQSVAVVDSIGVGAGVLDVLRHRGAAARSFVASAGTRRRDATGTQSFPNLRSAAWWNMRELLDPALDARLALPPDDDLTADLTAPRWEPRTGGKIQVESKDDTRSRIGRSTDRGDAVVMACWQEAPSRDPSAEPLKPIAYANAATWR